MNDCSKLHRSIEIDLGRELPVDRAAKLNDDLQSVMPPIIGMHDEMKCVGEPDSQLLQAIDQLSRDNRMLSEKVSKFLSNEPSDLFPNNKVGTQPQPTKHLLNSVVFAVHPANLGEVVVGEVVAPDLAEHQICSGLRHRKLWLAQQLREHN